MIPIVSIVGKSNSGKTTLIERLIPELTGRGYRVATIKHNMHGFQIDHEGKDSWRHKQAGAQVTVIASPHQVAVIEDVKRDYELSELRDLYIKDVDVVISEGFKKNPHPKIEVYRTAVRRQMICGPQDNLAAVAGDAPADPSIPHFGMDNIKGLADFIETRFLKNAD